MFLKGAPALFFNHLCKMHKDPSTVLCILPFWKKLEKIAKKVLTMPFCCAIIVLRLKHNTALQNQKKEVDKMKTLQELIHDVQLQLEYETDLLNGYRSKVLDLHKKIRNHATIIAHNVSPLHLPYHAAKIAEYSALLEEYNTEIEMLEKSIEIANSDIENLESEVK